MKKDTEIKGASGHRARLKEKFVEDKNSFSDVQLLELLLCYSIPRKDTSPIAKSAVEKFGSLNELLNTSFENLLKTPGIGQNSAVLIKLISLLKNKSDDKQLSGIFIKNIDDAVGYIRDYFDELTSEKLYVLGLTEKYELTGMQLLSAGSAITTVFSLKDILKFAVASNSSYIILTHNHKGDCAHPSKEDIELTALCASYLNELDVHLIDHIIISENNFFSFAADNLTQFSSTEYIS